MRSTRQRAPRTARTVYAVQGPEGAEGVSRVVSTLANFAGSMAALERASGIPRRTLIRLRDERRTEIRRDVGRRLVLAIDALRPEERRGRVFALWGRSVRLPWGGVGGDPLSSVRYPDERSVQEVDQSRTTVATTVAWIERIHRGGWRPPSDPGLVNRWVAVPPTSAAALPAAGPPNLVIAREPRSPGATWVCWLGTREQNVTRDLNRAELADLAYENLVARQRPQILSEPGAAACAEALRQALLALLQGA